MIWIRALWRCLLQLLLELRPGAPWVRSARNIGHWYAWASDARARARLRRVGWDMVQVIAGGAGEGVPGYLRLRVVNPRAINLGPDGFETAGGFYSAGSSRGPFLWHSLGTEAGSDQSKTFWADLAGVSTYAANTLSVPAAGKVQGGSDDWTDGTPWVRFKWVTGLNAQLLFHCVDANNYVYVGTDGTHIYIGKLVAGVNTTVQTVVTAALTNNSLYWLQLIANGTSYTGAIYNDTGPGGIGTQIGATAAQVIADAAVQTGAMGMAAGGAAMLCGGAFGYVCFTSAPAPDGWWPVVTSGEPAFALSKTTPQAGTYSASIQFRNAGGGAGYWQRYAANVLAGTNTLSCQAKASFGQANLSGGGLTTGNAGAAYGLLSVTGLMVANPVLQLNLAVGPASAKAYFDAISVAIDPTVAVITDDLPHLHQSEWKVMSLRPGNPGRAGIGTGLVRLHPPGSEEYAAAKGVYDQLARGLRVEAYIGFSGATGGLGLLKFAGIIRDKRLLDGPGALFELTLEDDLTLINLSAPFPGEVISDAATGGLIKNYMGTNELGGSDSFAAFNAGDYGSTSILGLTAGAWAAGTDDGVPVVQASTGTGAALISKRGVVAQDALRRQYVEASGRLVTTSLSAANAGSMGVGLSLNPSDPLNSIVGRVIAKWNAATVRYDLDAKIDQYVGGVLTSTTKVNALSSVDDPNGNISLTIGLLWQVNIGGLTNTVYLTVNGQTVISGTVVTPSPTIYTQYPFLFYGTPATGAATASVSPLNQFVRYALDGQPDAMVLVGQGFGQANKFPVGTALQSTFLEIWAACSAREAAYLRYTPKPFVPGVRTLGTLDFATDPGADLTARCLFAKGDNLESLELSGNADPLASNVVLLSPSGTDSGGKTFSRDPTGMARFGVLQDQVVSVITGFANTRRAAAQVVAAKLAVETSGAKSAVVARDATADVWRELDKITVHDPLININYLPARVVGYGFKEGEGTQPVTLDQVPASDQLANTKRQQQAVFRLASF